MATDLTELKAFLEGFGTAYSVQGEDTLVCDFGMLRYKNPAGETALRIKIHLREDGEFLIFRAPYAFSVSRKHIEAFSRACLILQKRAKLLRFEYDPADEEVAAVIELPLEDAKLTQKQFQRCLRPLRNLLETHYEELMRAAETGTVELSQDGPAEKAAVIDRLAAAVPAEVLEKALKKAAGKKGKKK